MASLFCNLVFYVSVKTGDANYSSQNFSLPFFFGAESSGGRGNSLWVVLKQSGLFFAFDFVDTNFLAEFI